jgi:hypothetical protein
MSIRIPSSPNISFDAPQPAEQPGAPAKNRATESRHGALPSMATHTSPTADRFHQLFTPGVQSTSAGPSVVPRRPAEWPRFRRGAQARANAGSQAHNSADEAARDTYVQQAALTLVNPDFDDGRVNTAAIDGLLEDLRKSPAWEGHEARRGHLEQTLQNLKQDGALRDDINAICDTPGKNPRGPAKAIVAPMPHARPGDTPGNAQARRTVVLALLDEPHAFAGATPGDAAALTRFVHRHMPRRAVQDWKTMLEDNHVRLTQGDARIQVPVNTYARGGSIRTPHVVSPDGRMDDGAPLPAMAGMQAALRALEIPESEWNNAVAGALGRLEVPANGKAVNCLQIIENIAHHA